MATVQWGGMDPVFARLEVIAGPVCGDVVVGDGEPDRGGAGVGEYQPDLLAVAVVVRADLGRGAARVPLELTEEAVRSMHGEVVAGPGRPRDGQLPPGVDGVCPRS